jgi:hypothetical protein
VVAQQLPAGVSVASLSKIQIEFQNALDNFKESEMQQFYYLDSKLIEAYYSQGDELQNLHSN